MEMAAESRIGREQLLQLLSGEGIEIGALHRPVTAPHLKIHYVDRYTREDLYNCYPELQGLPIVETDIIDDAESLKTIPHASQDFVIANHVIEHMRDPIGTMLAWQRVLRPGGQIFLAVPNRDTTFDRERSITTLEHLVEDHRNPSKERDFQAFLDFSRFVSCRFFKVKPESEYQSFARELEQKDYSIHFHVWDKPAFDHFLTYLEKDLPEWSMRVVDSIPAVVDEFVYVLKKVY